MNYINQVAFYSRGVGDRRARRTPGVSMLVQFLSLIEMIEGCPEGLWSDRAYRRSHSQAGSSFADAVEICPAACQPTDYTPKQRCKVTSLELVIPEAIPPSYSP